MDSFLKVKIDSNGNITLPWSWLCEMAEDDPGKGLDFIEGDDDSVVIRKYDPSEDADNSCWT